jgi:hypothetical protein
VKNILITGMVAVAAGAVAFGVGYTVNRQPELHRAASERDAMAWLRAEFHLTGAQFDAVKKLHDDYGAVCGEHCAAILAARARSAPAGEIASLEKICVEAMTAHFHRVAALMPADEGERYLATVLPRVDGYNHNGSPNVQVKP